MYIDQVRTQKSSKETEERALIALTSLLENKISYEDAKITCNSCLGSILPAERIESIIKLARGQHAMFENLPPTPMFMSKRVRVWSSSDDIMLLAGIYRFGLGNWKNIAIFVGNGKTRAQCCQRWSRALNPSINRDIWSEEDDCKLLSIVKTHGSRSWTEISNEMKTRSDVQCRYRYMQLMKVTDEETDDEFAFNPNLFNCTLAEMIPPLKINNKQAMR